MKISYQTILDYNHESQQYEENHQPSLTIPDQTMSIREIIDKYANGGVIETFNPYYGEEEDFNELLPDFRKMDLADRQQLAEEFYNELNTLQGSPSEVELPKSENDETAQEGN